MRILSILMITLMALAIACSSPVETPSGKSDRPKIYVRPPVDRKLSPVAVPLRTDSYHLARIPVNDLGPLEEFFNDSNYRQYAFAEKVGIDPLNSLSDIYYSKKPLVEIKTNDLYEVQELTHSFPYLVPEAAWLLEDIGAAFIDTLRNRGVDGYKLIVTSALRSPYLVKKLQKQNINAVDSSTHKFATTFDIAYNGFRCLDPNRTLRSEDLKQVLAEVLSDMRSRGRCLVKYEVKTPCFHITVTDK